MSAVLNLSDLHLGHQSICKFRTQFTTVEEHDSLIIENYLNLVRKQDRVHFNGDVAFTSEALNTIKKLPGRKILILGNHDTEFKKRGYTLQDLVDTFDEIHSFVRWHEFWLTHCPIHVDELRGKFNIHGHTHNHIIDNPNYLNICMEHINYTPISLEQIRDEFKKRGF